MECPTKNLLEGFAAAAMEYFAATDKQASLAGSHDESVIGTRL
jgi:hypothetical protein